MACSQEDNMKMTLDQIQALADLPKQIENVREDIKREVNAIKESLEFSQQQLTTAVLKLEDQSKAISKHETELKKEKQQRQNLEEKMLTMQHRLAMSEDYTRRYNLIIQGLMKDENCYKRVMAFFKTMRINENLRLDTAHRLGLGKPTNGKARQLIVRFLTQHDRS